MQCYHCGDRGRSFLIISGNVFECDRRGGEGVTNRLKERNVEEDSPGNLQEYSCAMKRR